jgi:hypothetical protein
MTDPGVTATSASALAPRRLTSQGRVLDLLVSSPGPGRPRVVVPAAPALSRDPAGQPQLSLTLLLSRRPGAGDAVTDLVQGGLLGLSAAVEVPPWALQALAAEGPLPRPLFARAARFALGLPGGGPALARADAAGPAPRAALSAMLSAEDACRVLAALQGQPSGLELRAELDWQPPGRARLETLALPAALEALLARAPGEPLDLDRLVRLTAPPAPGLPPEEVPPRVAAPARRAAPGALALAVSAGRITTLAAALQPTPAPATVAAQAAVLGKPGNTGIAGGIILGDGAEPTGAGSFPVVEDPSATLWPDRADPARRWWVPALELVHPGPNDDPAASPFLFSWKQDGVTGGAGGSSPAPGLEGNALFTLRVIQPAEVAAALHAAGDPPSQRAPLDGLAVALEVPFREEGTGQTRTQLFPAAVEVQGDVVRARVSLLDGWVRLCYGALAYEGFQAQPARLRISWSFAALVPVPPLSQIAFGGKLSAIPLLQAGPLPARAAFDPAAGALHLDGVQVRLEPEGGLARRGGPPPPVAQLRPIEPARASPLLALGNVAFHPLPAPAALHATPLPAVVARPELELSPAWLSRLHQARYLGRTVARAQALDALLPCKDSPTAYRRVQADGTDAAAGCQDALRLGAIEYRQYEELPDLRRDDAGGRLCSVYRSLQQPGRYLIAPARWRISRYAPDAGQDRAYRPTAMLYALRDADAPETRYFLSAQLEPDLPLHVRRELGRRLAALAPAGQAPVIDYPTEPSLQAKVDVQWAVPDKLATPQTSATWDGFQVTVSAGLADAVLLTTAIEKGGLAGQATFTLPDGQALTGELRLDTAFTGPWSGPLEVVALGDSKPGATLRNRLDVPVDVTALLPDAGRSDAAVTVEAALAPGASVDVALPATPADPCPVAAPRPGTPRLSETDVFVEDVTLGVIFVNLVAYANHGLAGLALDARLQGTDHVYGVDLQEGQHATLELQLPLDRYVQSQVLEVRLRATPAAGAAVAGDWWTWDLEARGSVVSITPGLLPAASRAIAPPREGPGPTAGPGSGGARRKDGAMKRIAKRGGPLGISIHIGLNHVDPNAYDGWDGELSGCLNDANAMKAIAQAMGYDPVHELHDEEATAEAVLSAICDAANQLQSGDHLLLTYSGHGGQIPDTTGDEDDKLDETWVLHDRQLLDDELYAEWSKFAAGVRIFVLSDSCHSGTVIRDLPRMQDFQRLQQAAASARGLRAAPPKLRAIPPAKALANYEKNRSLYRGLQVLLKGGAQNTKDTIGATVLLISGCQDNQFSQDGSTNGLFTEKLLQVWDQGAFQGTHHDFYSAILEKMPSEQTPNYFTVGTTIDLAFLNMRPFLIGEAQAGQDTSTGTSDTTGDTSAAKPSIRGPASVSVDDDPPTLQVDPSPYGFYAVEVATDPSCFYGGSGQRTAATSYCSWTDVHRTTRGSDREFTLPATAWDALKGASRLYLRVWATKNAGAADWQPYQVADGGAPIEVSSERGAVIPPPAPRAMPPGNGDATQAAMH